MATFRLDWKETLYTCYNSKKLYRENVRTAFCASHIVILLFR